MRREGRQHGMVRTLPILSGSRLDSRRTPIEISAPPTAGLFTKAPSKPTNHSKFTGKCARPMCRDCHIHPTCKSKAKAKGAHKVRSPSSELGLVGLRVVGPSGVVDVYGSSATVVLDYLDSHASDDLAIHDFD